MHSTTATPVAILHGLLFNDMSSNQRLEINVSGLHCLSYCSGLIKTLPLTYFNQLSREGSSGRATFILKFQEKTLCQIILPMLQQSPYISYEARWRWMHVFINTLAEKLMQLMHFGEFGWLWHHQWLNLELIWLLFTAHDLCAIFTCDRGSRCGCTRNKQTNMFKYNTLIVVACTKNTLGWIPFLDLSLIMFEAKMGPFFCLVFRFRFVSLFLLNFFVYQNQNSLAGSIFPVHSLAQQKRVTSVSWS